jgi:hypothetical protein
MIAKISLKYGLFLGVSVVICTQALTWLGLGLTNWFVLFTFLCVIIFSYLGVKELKLSSGGQISFGKAALSVVIIILLSRMIFQIYMFVYTQYIDPDWVNTVIESWTETLQEANTPADKIEKQMTAFRKSYEPLSMFTIQLINYGLPQIVIGIVAALPLVLKKKK